MTWRPLGAVLPTQLADARVQLHFAAQLVSAPGTSLLPHQSDYSETNLGWDSELSVLTGRAVGADSLVAALVFESLELAVLKGGGEHASQALAGSGIGRGLDWLSERLGAKDALRLPEHEPPAHPLADGAPFTEAHHDARAELAAWFANATDAVRGAVQQEPSSSPVRCWPHHFDVASLITLDSGADAEEARSIGVGFSPGDPSYAQPYFYVTPWPYPAPGSLPPLSSGARWHEEGWTGAVLLGESIVAQRHERQADFVAGALREAMDASRAALER